MNTRHNTTNYSRLLSIDHNSIEPYKSYSHSRGSLSLKATIQKKNPLSLKPIVPKTSLRSLKTVAQNEAVIRRVMSHVFAHRYTFTGKQRWQWQFFFRLLSFCLAWGPDLLLFVHNQSLNTHARTHIKEKKGVVNRGCYNIEIIPTNGIAPAL